MGAGQRAESELRLSLPLAPPPPLPFLYLPNPTTKPRRCRPAGSRLIGRRAVNRRILAPIDRSIPAASLRPVLCSVVDISALPARPALLALFLKRHEQHGRRHRRGGLWRGLGEGERRGGQWGWREVTGRRWGEAVQESDGNFGKTTQKPDPV
ncbi:hypothetical protein BRADI_4g24933v3 [Brachypodium distachyon]|uniref:Uncharacterized protein n=1 Tax=Brachypodium distachyon TaxID=15368 RepID=A0A2K2CQ39_BRADI|nr:hypothetical protein BRADI_4g24933v3 [Brachypodium distachyon]